MISFLFIEDEGKRILLGSGEVRFMEPHIGIPICGYEGDLILNMPETKPGLVAGFRVFDTGVGKIRDRLFSVHEVLATDAQSARLKAQNGKFYALIEYCFLYNGVFYFHYYSRMLSSDVSIRKVITANKSQNARVVIQRAGVTNRDGEAVTRLACKKFIVSMNKKYYGCLEYDEELQAVVYEGDLDDLIKATTKYWR